MEIITNIIRILARLFMHGKPDGSPEDVDAKMGRLKPKDYKPDNSSQPPPPGWSSWNSP